MRSISLKIILVLVIVSLAGALFTAFFVQYRTQTAFNNFILDENQALFYDVLIDYYQTNGGWEGVESLFRSANQPMMGPGMAGGPRENNAYRMVLRGPMPFVLADVSGSILAGSTLHSGYQSGELVPDNELRKGLRLEQDDQLIGWLIEVPISQPKTNSQQAFLNSVQRGLFFSSLITLLIALILGGFLINSFTRPIRKLADATEIVAEGDLGYQVEITSKDELGRLAASFNTMSTDLEKSDRSRKQMTADIAHDLRTPLSVLHGYTEAMSEGKLKGTPEIYQVMHQQAQHLNYLIDDLRTLSLLDSNQLKLQIQDIDPGLVVQDVISAFTVQAETKAITLKALSTPDLPRLNLDPDRLTQILGNLLTNAINILEAGDEILVTTLLKANWLVIEVKDDGPGIEAEQLPYIFDRFYRTDTSRQSDDGSSGLGLAITRKLVEAQGGEITAQSVVGEGTSFLIRFPTN